MTLSHTGGVTNLAKKHPLFKVKKQGVILDIKKGHFQYKLYGDNPQNHGIFLGVKIKILGPTILTVSVSSESVTFWGLPPPIFNVKPKIKTPHFGQKTP